MTSRSSISRTDFKSVAPLRSALNWSLAGHLLVLLMAALADLFHLSNRSIPYIPTLKVDLVALPDVLKKDLVHPSQPKLNEEINHLLKKTEPPATKIKVNPTPNRAGTRVEARNLQALARIKALSKIQNFKTEEESEPTQKPMKPILGNKISPGKSLSGEAKEASESSYYDILRDQLKENWTLPPWIARQNLSAQIRLFIDEQGSVKRLLFEKLSGNLAFDEAVKKAIQLSQPLQKPPQNLKSSLISNGIRIGFPL